ncbi:DUF6166 domain-containing protein (plasmid) [Halorientalis pallida]|uniref:DUF6166 domain-containing protein n=1 Tax=Halorientalis pallida TaxID=2479928 RepID=UPI003C6EE1C2
MPAKTDYSRKSKYKATVYRGERSLGGNIVYAGDHLLDKHLFVHDVATGGFDWGPDADDDRACQLAIALLAPIKGVDTAVEEYHLFATNVVKRELTGDSWEIKRQDLRSQSHLEKRLDREYPQNTAPSPADVPDLDDSDLDLESITYAEEIALAEKYEDVLWTQGNRRENLQRLRSIWAGEVDPSTDSLGGSSLYHLLPGLSSAARNALSKKFETMGDLAAWVLYERDHARLKGIGPTSAKTIQENRDVFVQYFGGEQYIPDYEGDCLTLDRATETPVSEGQQTLH